MKILIVLNYYTPYISGVTEAARIEAEELAKEEEKKRLKLEKKLAKRV